MTNIEKQLKKKIEQLEKLGKEIAQLQQVSRNKKVEALRLDGAISALKELQNENTKDTPEK